VGALALLLIRSKTSISPNTCILSLVNDKVGGLGPCIFQPQNGAGNERACSFKDFFVSNPWDLCVKICNDTGALCPSLLLVLLQAAVEDLHRQLSTATNELTALRTSQRVLREELDVLKNKHEQLVKAGVEIAQVGIFIAEWVFPCGHCTGLHAREKSPCVCTTDLFITVIQKCCALC
jgi:hypothetical protein